MLTGTCFINIVKVMYLFFPQISSVIVEIANVAHRASLEREVVHSWAFLYLLIKESDRCWKFLEKIQVCNHY